VEYTLVHADVEDLSDLRYALVEDDVELGLAERGSDLVLHDLHTHAVAAHLGLIALLTLDRADAPHVEPHGGVELERVAARRSLRRPEHHSDLHADLVDEQNRA